MLAFSVREALRQAAAAFGPPGVSVDLASPATPEAVCWAVEEARAAAPDSRSTVTSTEGGPGVVPDQPDRRPAPLRRTPSRPQPCRHGELEAGTMDWLAAVERLRRDRMPGVLVTLTCGARATRPARPAPRWSSRPTRHWGSIGGGNLEATAVDRARAIDRWPASDRPEHLSLSLNDRAPVEHGQQCCGGEVSILLEPLAVAPSVAIFGMGHVGLELARILARHDLELHLVDSRARPARRRTARASWTTPSPGCTCTTRRCPSWSWARCRPGTHVLVMTHDHAEDAALCDGALRCEHLGSVGLIGSSAKWRRFRERLAAEGHSPAELAAHPDADRAAELTGKEPATIAVSAVAADLRPRAVRRPMPGASADVARRDQAVAIR